MFQALASPLPPCLLPTSPKAKAVAETRETAPAGLTCIPPGQLGRGQRLGLSHSRLPHTPIRPPSAPPVSPNPREGQRTCWHFILTHQGRGRARRCAGRLPSALSVPSPSPLRPGSALGEPLSEQISPCWTICFTAAQSREGWPLLWGQQSPACANPLPPCCRPPAAGILQEAARTAPLTAPHAAAGWEAATQRGKGLGRGRMCPLRGCAPPLACSASPLLARGWESRSGQDRMVLWG